MRNENCRRQEIGLLTRRRLLQVGSLGLLGLTLPDLLQARAASPSRNRSEKSCIFIMQYGGMSHIDSLDPKPDAPEALRGPYKPISTRIPGVRFGELLPRLASLAGDFCLIRSMSHGNGGHDGGMHICMTGNSRPDASTPYFGSVLAKMRPSAPTIPSYVWIQNLAGDVKPYYLTGGILGATYSPLRIGQDLDNPSVPGFRVKVFDPPQDVPPERLARRQELLTGVEPAGSPLLRTPGGRTFLRHQERALELAAGKEARQAFDLEREPAVLRDRYGRGPLGQNLLLARRLIEAGVRLVTVTAWTGLPPGEKFRNVQTWDMHGGGLGSIFGTGHFGLGWALPRVDESVSALLEDLKQRGLLDTTLVVMVGEFGRTPRMEGKDGRNHWPHCYAALLAGAGIRGGVVFGTSDSIGAYVKDSPVSPEDFGATLFHALGVPLESRVGPAEFMGQPVSTGKPIVGIFG